MNKFQSAMLKATDILNDRYSKSDIKKMHSGKRTADCIEIIHDAVQTLVLSGIPTCTIAEVMEKTKGTIQYHARWLESQGRIRRYNARGHWRQAEVINENK